MKKKVAVLISGIYPDYLQRKDLLNNLTRIENIFKGCDFYYQTWDTPLYRHIFKPVNRDIFWIKEPNVSRGNLQHLGFSKLYSKVPKKYDLYIRTRWDAYININFPAQDIFDLAQKNVVGIATIKNRVKPSNDQTHYENFMKYRKLAARRQDVKDYVDRGVYHVDPNSSHCGYLSDFLIAFKECDYEINSAEKLVERVALSNAEIGWHQILCRKRPNVNIHGLVAILRTVDTSFETYLKLKEAKFL